MKALLIISSQTFDVDLNLLKPEGRSSEWVCSLNQSSLCCNMQSQPCKTCLDVPSRKLHSDQNIFLSLHLTNFWTFNYSSAFRLFFTAQRFSFLLFPAWSLNIDHLSLGAGMHKKVSNRTLHVWMYKTTLKIYLWIKKTIEASAFPYSCRLNFST